MLCDACKKLAFLHTKKTCMKCQGTVFTNINLLCETCSTSANCCSACLKKLYSQSNHPAFKNQPNGCRSCGR